MSAKIAEGEEKKLIERMLKDADGILIFVSPRVHSRHGTVLQYRGPTEAHVRS